MRSLTPETAVSFKQSLGEIRNLRLAKSNAGNSTSSSTKSNYQHERLKHGSRKKNKRLLSTNHLVIRSISRVFGRVLCTNSIGGCQPAKTRRNIRLQKRTFLFSIFRQEIKVKERNQIICCCRRRSSFLVSK